MRGLIRSVLRCVPLKYVIEYLVFPRISFQAALQQVLHQRFTTSTAGSVVNEGIVEVERNGIDVGKAGLHENPDDVFVVNAVVIPR
jgi:hypothetical protein